MIELVSSPEASPETEIGEPAEELIESEEVDIPEPYAPAS